MQQCRPNRRGTAETTNIMSRRSKITVHLRTTGVSKVQTRMEEILEAVEKMEEDVGRENTNSKKHRHNPHIYPDINTGYNTYKALAARVERIAREKKTKREEARNRHDMMPSATAD